MVFEVLCRKRKESKESGERKRRKKENFGLTFQSETHLNERNKWTIWNQKVTLSFRPFMLFFPVRPPGKRLENFGVRGNEILIKIFTQKPPFNRHRWTLPSSLPPLFLIKFIYLFNSVSVRFSFHCPTA